MSVAPSAAEMLGGHDYAREKEAWLHDHHWDSGIEVQLTAVGQAGQKALGAAVAAGNTRRIREVTVRNEGTNRTVVSLFVDGNCILSFHVGATSSVVWFSEDGREIAAGKTVYVRTSDVTGGNTNVTASGVEAP